MILFLISSIIAGQLINPFDAKPLRDDGSRLQSNQVKQGPNVLNIVDSTDWYFTLKMDFLHQLIRFRHGAPEIIFDNQVRN